MEKHVPVLLEESIKYLNIKPDGIYVDCTLGRAGHSSEILKRLKQGKLFSIDQDETAIIEGTEKLSKVSDNFKILRGNFANISAMLAIEGIFGVDGILYDLGVSSPQFDVAERGFSYRFDGPLDMRMDRTNNSLTAHEIVNNYSHTEIEKILWNYGDEKFARSIAKNIVNSRPINTTFELVSVIKKSLPFKILNQQKHPAKKTFQALRIKVNNEMDALENSLEQSIQLLNPKGRVVVITFHSLEEKVVKEIFKKYTLDEQQYYLNNLPYELESTKDYKLLFKKPLKPTEKEVEDNNRSHSAKLWVIEKK
ncbi:16S rRNA (cytosine(1402)-N(4))-methyltransferase RsmH [Mesoplasma chauliocola]|uniref:Ribosomal RNA small subunit methyltransferase H n=1 Tax=Mesoplasma chauliocola TaxID=216427 RepID=A0A249SNE9_9MOLU|nr:16S rRNA (cytosine(1402)-N(4))-methyltransferase RsmH [Mesoplasma chauliocola]ASZ09166.1 16S rRNA (cytosine(1402)-N(4))-methyltransferase RsmH [Mesoplasma chauliocola]